MFNESSIELSADAQKTLLRFMRIKLESYQFFGIYNYGLNIFQGMKSLCLAYSLIILTTRMFTIANFRKEANSQDVKEALEIIAHSWGRSPLMQFYIFRKLESDIYKFRLKNLLFILSK